MPNLVDWKIYYDSGAVFSSHNGKWEDAPGDGIQVLVEFYDDGTRKLHYEKDYYILDDGKAFGTNNINPWLRKYNIVKSGRWAKDSYFREIANRAKQEEL